MAGTNTAGRGKGNWGNPDQHKKAGQMGGNAVVEKYGADHMAAIGSNGGKLSGGNFKNDRERAAKAGSEGGKSTRSAKA